jgi:multidrug resistance efflux pump
MAALDTDQQRQHLAQAEPHIAEAEAHIARQREHIEKLRQEGHGTGLAESMLHALKTSLHAFEHHRKLILEQLESESK